MNFLQFIIRHGRIFSLLVILLPIVAGTFAYQSLPKEGQPDITMAVAMVITTYPGASPGEIESLVTNPLEEALSDLKDLKEMRSSSAESVSIIVIDFETEADLETSLQKVREKVTDTRKDLPDEADDSTVLEISNSDIPIMLLSIVGDLDPVHMKRLAEDVADEIELMPEILSADVSGGLTREIQLYLDPERLNQYGLTILDAYNAVLSADVNIPAGMVDVAGRRLILRTLTEIKNIKDYERVPLIRQGDQVVFLGDVGTVKDGHIEDVTYSRVNGRSSVSIAVKKRTGANILMTSAKVKKQVQEIEKGFPAGVRIVYTSDQTRYIQQDFDMMSNSAVLGLIIVILVLYFAMGLRNSVITSLSIPLSLLITFILLKVFGQTNNTMVRFSLILCIGLLVDVAIIVVENVYHHFQLGKDRLTAVIEGTAEIAAPVISATLTTVAAFLPMLLMTGVTGDYMGIIPKTITIALSASLIVALIANPLILARFMKRSVKDGVISRPEDDLVKLKRIYVRVVSWALNHRSMVVVFAIIALACAINLILMNVIKIEMYPEIDFDNIYITIETPAGTDVEITDQVAREVERIVQEQVPEAVQITSVSGTRGQSAHEITFSGGVISNYAEVTVEILDGKEYARESQQIIQKRLRPYLNTIPGAEIRFRPLTWGPPVDAPILVKIMGQELDVMRKITEDVKEILSRIHGAVEIKDDFSDAPPELRVEIDREQAAALGVPLNLVAITLRGATAGLDIREFRDELDISREYDLKVRFSPESRTSPQMLEKVRIRSQTGELIPLSNIARFSHGPGINTIGHVDRRRVIKVSARNEARSAVEITKEFKTALEQYPLPNGYGFDFSGEFKETEKSFGSLKLAYLVAFLLIFTLLVTQFNSYVQPLAIMTALPLSIIGAVVGLLVTGNSFTIMGFIGLVGLTGIVVNDSIVLVDCINRMRETGMNIFNAIVAAGQQRLRPIISTTLSTIGGIITLTIVDEMWEGLGVVIIFGIGFATVLTLVVVPVMYSLFEGMGYFTISAIKGPRWKDAPSGKSFFFTRRPYSRLWLCLFALIQVMVLSAGISLLGPEFASDMRSTVLRAPSLLLLSIETIVEILGFALRIAGVAVLLVLPFWLGLICLLGRKARDADYVEVTEKGITITSPAELMFLSMDEINGVYETRFFNGLIIHSGKQKRIIRGILEVADASEKTSLLKWLGTPAPSREKRRRSMLHLKKAIEKQINR